MTEKMTEKKSVEARYASIEKQHKLPPYKDLSAEFDVEIADAETKYPLREIAKKVFEKTDMFRKVLEAMLQPDVSVTAMQEVEYLSEADHLQVGDVLRRLMRLDRQLLMTELENTDAGYAQFIRDAMKEWPGIKKDLAPILAKLEKGWATKHRIQPKRDSQYLG